VESGTIYTGALDIGGTKTLAAIIDGSGTILEKYEWKTRIDDYDAHFERCGGELCRLAENSGIRIADLAGIGINFPGMMDSEKGILVHAPNAGWRNLPVRDFFKTILKHPNIIVGNDVDACAIGEEYFGLGSQYRRYIWITISTGIGSAFMIDGKIYQGAGTFAGEAGHLKVEYDKPRKCSCGQYGCMQAYASGPAIKAIVQEKIEADPGFGLAFKNANLSADAIGCETLARSGNKTALDIYRDAAEYLARGIGYCVNILNPKAIILGGGVARALDIFEKDLFTALKKYTVEPSLKGLEIKYTRLGYEAALIGAAASVLAKL